MSKYRLFAIFFLITTAHCYRYMHLDQKENKDKVRFCEISGYVHRESFQVYGELYNCQSPPMNCSIPFEESLTTQKRNIECRGTIDNDWFFHNDSECAYRFYYRSRTVCEDENHCFSIAITCFPTSNPKFLFWLCVIGAPVLSCFLLVAIFYFCFFEHYRVGNYVIRNQKQSKAKIANDHELQELHPSLTSSVAYVP